MNLLNEIKIKFYPYYHLIQNIHAKMNKVKKILIVLVIVFVLSSCNDEKMCSNHQDTMSKDSNDYSRNLLYEAWRKRIKR